MNHTPVADPIPIENSNSINRTLWVIKKQTGEVRVDLGGVMGVEWEMKVIKIPWKREKKVG